MSAPVRICRARGIAVVLASGAAISLAAVTGGIGPASAMPGATTTTYAPVPAPRAPLPTHEPPPLPPPGTHEAPQTYDPPPTHEAPPPPPPTQIPETNAPATTTAPVTSTPPAATPR